MCVSAAGRFKFIEVLFGALLFRSRKSSTLGQDIKNLKYQNTIQGWFPGNFIAFIGIKLW